MLSRLKTLGAMILTICLCSFTCTNNDVPQTYTISVNQDSTVAVITESSGNVITIRGLPGRDGIDGQNGAIGQMPQIEWADSTDGIKVRNEIQQDGEILWTDWQFFPSRKDTVWVYQSPQGDTVTVAWRKNPELDVNLYYVYYENEYGAFEFWHGRDTTVSRPISILPYGPIWFYVIVTDYSGNISEDSETVPFERLR